MECSRHGTPICVGQQGPNIEDAVFNTVATSHAGSKHFEWLAQIEMSIKICTGFQRPYHK